MKLNNTLSGGLYTRAGARKYLTAAERERFIAAARNCVRPELRTLALTLVYSGCRISEALGVTAQSVNVEEGFIVFRTLKRRHGAIVMREVPMPAALLADIASTHEIAGLPPAARLWPFCRSHAWVLVKELIKDAGIAPGEHATCKGLRHGLGAEAMRKGIPITVLQRLFGHASLQSTMVYYQAIGVDERAWVTRLWGGP